MVFKYKGDLARRIEPPAVGLLMTDDEVKKIAKSMLDEELRRMGLLFQAHGIVPNNWMDLCFALAQAHVPGFQLAKARSGRPTKWHDYDRAKLVLAVEKTGLCVEKAAEILVKEEPWKSMTKAARGAATLRDQYMRADKRMVRLFRAAEEFDALSDAEKERVRASIVGEV